MITTMKLKLLFSPFVFCLVFGCGSRSTSEKAIADFVQTDKQGVWTDLQFEVIEMGEPVMITVGDSIRILKETFEKNGRRSLILPIPMLSVTAVLYRKRDFRQCGSFIRTALTSIRKWLIHFPGLSPCYLHHMRIQILRKCWHRRLLVNIQSWPRS